MQRSCIRAVPGMFKEQGGHYGWDEGVGSLWAIADLSFYSEGVGESLEGSNRGVMCSNLLFIITLATVMRICYRWTRVKPGRPVRRLFH